MRSFSGRVFLGLVIGLVLVGVVGLAASQTFVNKTGSDVYGIKVEFSQKVTITRHDYAFPDQTPKSGRSVEFTFSGGKLRNFGRFTIVWIPGTGRVVNYEWLKEEVTAPPQPEEEQPKPEAPAQPATPSLPDPNTPPILYGDDYPGPDEPVYSPQPGEKIWHTDLEGHADVYDNDGIKINCAPGVTIDRVQWYRNGTHLSFLDNKLLITNAQMKTFAGDEKKTVVIGGRKVVHMVSSQPSSHTDHAIMGYEYSAYIWNTAGHLWILKKTVKSGFRWHPIAFVELDAAWMYTMYHCGEDPHDRMAKFFTKLKHDGFSGVAFDIHFYMTSPFSNNIYALPEPNSHIMPYLIHTPSVKEINILLDAIKAAGLKVIVRGHIAISESYQAKHGSVYTGNIKPTDPHLFFSNYGNLWVSLLKELNGKDIYLVEPFVETDFLERYTTEIQHMYDRLSKVFDGRFAFEEATANILNRTSIVSHKVAFKDIAGRFWNWSDRFGRPLVNDLDCWTPVLETQKDQRVTVMVNTFPKFFAPALDYYRENYPHTPLRFGELGVDNADGVGMGSAYFYSDHNKIFDFQEVSDIWLAYLISLKKLGIDDFTLWAIPLCDRWDVEYPGNYFVNFYSPAYRVITAIIKPEE